MKLTWKPIMAGILDIVGGAIGMVGGLYFVALASLFRVIREFVRLDPHVIQRMEQIIQDIFAVPFVVVFIGIIAIIGGVYALQRRIWGLALAGSICSCMVFPFFGLPSIIITALAKDEFN
jgi:hypothetical protein